MEQAGEIKRNELLAHARTLVTALEDGAQQQEVEQLLGMLAESHQSLLFNRVGSITRQLHESLTNLPIDTSLIQLAEAELPDAKDRLNYVVSLTEQSAHSTLAAVEEAMPYAEKLVDRSGKLQQRLLGVAEENSDNPELCKVIQQMDTYLNSLQADGDKVQQKLTDILMAQEFQDLTGQLINRVIHMVQEVEDNLVELIRVTGVSTRTEAPAEEQTADQKKNKAIEAEGPQVPNSGNNVVNSQDEVDDLLASLGF